MNETTSLAPSLGDLDGGDEVVTGLDIDWVLGSGGGRFNGGS